MIRRFTTLITILLVISTSLTAQVVTFKVDAVGISPRDAAKSTTDIYTTSSTGLRNVGLGSLVYFKAEAAGKKFENLKWALTRKPLGSTATVGVTIDKVNDSTVVTTFVPDKMGAYTLTATDGAFTASVNFNAAKYIGYQNKMVNGVDTKVNCNTCHSSIVSVYEQTGHANSLQKGLDGIASSHFGANCVSCHSTGYDKGEKAINDGFDDLPFTFPAVLAAGNYAKLVAEFPEAMQRANVQCESCHGPASAHLGATTDERIDVSVDPGVCASCHDSGTHHLLPEQFDASLHSRAVDESGPGREGCVRCHTGIGFAQFAKGIPTNDPYFDVSYSPVTCAGCHDPHNAKNPYQLRLASAQLLAPGGTKITVDASNTGTAALCFNCHQSRTEANAAVAAATINLRFGPHHGPQGDMLLSNNMLELAGVKLATSNHLGATNTACVRCHMAGVSTEIDANGNVVPVGGHSFAVRTADGKDNMESCAQCHGSTFGNHFADVKFYLNGSGDHDNDGVVEGLQDEVRGMIEKVMKAMPLKAGQTAPVPETAWTKEQRQAYWNAKTAEEDQSNGIHNPKYIVTALRGAMKLMNIATAVEDEEANIPTEYVVYSNYPNPFNPSTNIKFALPKATQVNVTIYDALGKEVATLVNDELSAGTHNIQWNAAGMASGLYLYKVEAGNFVKVNKMMLLK